MFPTFRRALGQLSPVVLASVLLVGATASQAQTAAAEPARTGTSTTMSAVNTGAPQPSPPTSSATAAVRASTAQNSLSLGIIIDESSAMKAEPATVRAAVDRLVKPMGDDDEAFVLAARDKPELLQDFTADREDIDRKLSHLKMKGKGSLFDAIMTALNHFDDASNERMALVVLAAGEDNGSGVSLDAIRQKLANTRIPIYCVAARNTSWESQALLQQLASLNEGAALFPRRDKDFTNASGEISRRLFGENALAAKQKPLGSYDVAIVKSIPVASGPDTATFPEGDNVILQKMLVRSLRTKRLFSQVVDDTTADGIDQTKSVAQGSGTPVEVMGTVLEYKPPFQRQMRFFRMGGRTAIVKVQFLFRDARTGKIVMKSVQEGKVDTGVLGGSPEKLETQAVLRVVDQTINEIARSR